MVTRPMARKLPPLLLPELVLLPDNFNQDAFSAAAVKFAVEDLLPRSKVQSALGNGDHYFPAHDLTFQMRVGIIFPGSVMVIGINGLVRRQLFQPAFIIAQEAFLRV